MKWKLSFEGAAHVLYANHPREREKKCLCVCVDTHRTLSFVVYSGVIKFRFMAAIAFVILIVAYLLAYAEFKCSIGLHGRN